MAIGNLRCLRVLQIKSAAPNGLTCLSAQRALAGMAFAITLTYSALGQQAPRLMAISGFQAQRLAAFRSFSACSMTARPVISVAK
jgi:hypothetical protein